MSGNEPVDPPGAEDGLRFDSTMNVLERARAGDSSAARLLLERTVGPLRRWARGRLPNYARAGADTGDIVQDVVVRALARIEEFDHRTVEGLQAYLRQSVRNRIKDEIRRISRHPAGDDVLEALEDPAPSPLEQLLLQQRTDRYQEGLRTLRPDDRLAVIYRLEHQCSFSDIAKKLGKSSPDAARMAVSRALERLADAMGLEPPADVKR